MQGFIKLHRKMLDNPIVCKDSEHLAVWTYLLLNATHKEYPASFQGKKITLQPGQLITGRKVIADKFRISESKVQRILKSFEIEQQIEQQNGTKNRLITVVSWDEYQSCEQQNEQVLNNKRTTTEQQLNTNKNVKNVENDKNVQEEDIKIIGVATPKRTKFIAPSLEEVSSYCFDRGSLVDPMKWYDYYTSNGWRVGKNPMKDWKAAVRTWERANTTQTNVKQFQPRNRQGTSGKVITPGITDRSGKSLSEEEMNAIIRKAERWEEKRPGI